MANVIRIVKSRRNSMVCTLCRKSEVSVVGRSQDAGQVAGVREGDQRIVGTN